MDDFGSGISGGQFAPMAGDSFGSGIESGPFAPSPVTPDASQTYDWKAGLSGGLKGLGQSAGQFNKPVSFQAGGHSYQVAPNALTPQTLEMIRQKMLAHQMQAQQKQDAMAAQQEQVMNYYNPYHQSYGL
jgi:hypothetical protein